MDVLVLGAGTVGKVVAHDLSTENEVVIGDNDEKNLREIDGEVETTKIDANDEDEIVELSKDFDLLVGALPGKLGLKSMSAAIESKTDMVDVSFLPEDPFLLHDQAKKAGVSIVVDAGFGPGMSNIFMGNISKKLDHIERGIIRVGGLPKEPQPPLFYKLIWSPSDLMEEYKRKARVIENGEIIEKEPLEEIREVSIKGEEYEEFYSDGLRTLLRTIDAENLEETTLRWKGHLSKMKTLKELGFLENGNLDLTLDIITPKMQFDSPDISIMHIEIEGEIEGERKKIRYFVYDEEKEFSSMGRVTGFTAAAVARLFKDRELEKGIIPPENLGEKDQIHDRVIDELTERGIQIERSERIIG